jgi:heat shock protein HslJ
LRSFSDVASGDLTAAAPGAPATATFTTEDVSGTTGCNRYSGAFTLSAGGAIAFTPMMSTKMACDAPVNAQEHGLLTAFENAAKAVTADDGSLQFLNRGGETILIFDPAST